MSREVCLVRLGLVALLWSSALACDPQSQPNEPPKNKDSATKPRLDLGVVPIEDVAPIEEDARIPVGDIGFQWPDAPSPDLFVMDAPWANPDHKTTKKDHAVATPDTKPPKDADPPIPSFPSLPSPTKVAAVQYGEGQAGNVNSGCATNPAPNLCAIKMMVLQARIEGASFIVTPEYALIPDQEYLEPYPTLGENPGTDTTWPDDLFIKIFSQWAQKLGVYLVINLLTYTGTQANHQIYNTDVAFDSSGTIIGLHRKFELFGNENTSLTPGNDVMVFSTPLGKMGILICADIYGDASLLNKLTNTLDARVIAFSSFWTTSGAVNWQEDFAKNYGVYLIAANTTISPGHGGGIYDPSGNPLAQEIKTKPSIVYADIPLP
jgi:predicted amidohydrolase